MTAQSFSHDTLVLLCNNISDAVVVVDQDNRVSLFNAAAEAVFYTPADKILGRKLNRCAPLKSLVPLFEQAYTGGGYTTEVTLPSDILFRARFIVAPDKGCVAVFQPARSPDDTRVELANMIADIVHDLKSPISSTKGFIELIEAAGSLSDRQATFAQRAQSSLEYMLSLVHELLDMAWLESGASLDISHVDLNDLVRHTASQFEDYARRQGVEFELVLPPDGCQVEADDRRLLGVIGNLVSNAIKYSPDGGIVRMSVSVKDHAVTCSIADQGLGISQDYLPHIFERFYRVHTPETRRIEGSGLGLAIVEAVIKKHGGSVFVDSTPGEGSVFGFSLQLSSSN
ncbi:MAG: PAS domain-containing sensor histidine kinase [Anaerolineae bacterium]|nr:PAS domain-containing sensor histidine kinase [Anaerolineae bacterium]